MKQKRIFPLRIIVFIAALTAIQGMWIQKDCATLYESAENEALLPMIAIIVATSLLKITALTLAALLFKWAVQRFKRK